MLKQMLAGLLGSAHVVEVRVIVRAIPLTEQSGSRPTTFGERRILEVCTHEPQTAKRIAGHLGPTPNSYFRGQLTSLCRKELLVRTPDGYKLP
jgi:hypothetical protein